MTQKAEMMRAIVQMALTSHPIVIRAAFRPECASCSPYVDKVAIWDSNRKIRG